MSTAYRIACLPIVPLILSTHVGFCGGRIDTCVWKLSSNGEFSVKTAYNSIVLGQDLPPWKWEFIWKLHIPRKIKTFLWVLCHNKLLTIAQRVKRGLASSANCPRCNYPIESIEHLVKDCRCSTVIWSKFGSNSTVPSCFGCFTTLSPENLFVMICLVTWFFLFVFGIFGSGAVNLFLSRDLGCLLSLNR